MFCIFLNSFEKRFPASIQNFEPEIPVINGEDFEQVHQSYRKFHPAFVEGW